MTEEGKTGLLKGLGWLRGIPNISSVSDLDRVTVKGSIFGIVVDLHSIRCVEVHLFVWMLVQLLWTESLLVQRILNTCM